MPNQAPWAPPSHIQCYSQIPSQNSPPWPWVTWLPSKITWSSHDDCATMHHLISRPSGQQTWDLRVPTLFLSNLFSSYGMLMLLNYSAVPVCITVLNPNLEANCMHPCALFESLSPSPPCGQAPLLQMPPRLCPNSLLVPVTLWLYFL